MTSNTYRALHQRSINYKKPLRFPRLLTWLVESLKWLDTWYDLWLKISGVESPISLAISLRPSRWMSMPRPKMLLTMMSV